MLNLAIMSRKPYMIPIILGLVLQLSVLESTAQCYGTTFYPAASITPDDTGIPTTISTASWAGIMHR